MIQADRCDDCGVKLADKFYEVAGSHLCVACVKRELKDALVDLQIEMQRKKNGGTQPPEPAGGGR